MCTIPESKKGYAPMPEFSDRNGRRRGRSKNGVHPTAGESTAGKEARQQKNDSNGERGALTQERVPDEIVEWESPLPLYVPVELHLPGKVLTERWRIDRILFFQGFVTLVCLLSVVLVPETSVQISAVAICLGGFGFARYLLRRAYHK
jgi:hypothetical protein